MNKPKINELYVDDMEEMYVVREVFTQSCIVCPLANKECLACEIMEFASLETEGWKSIGQLK